MSWIKMVSQAIFLIILSQFVLNGCQESVGTSEVKAQSQLQDIGQLMFIIATDEKENPRTRVNVKAIAEAAKAEQSVSFSFAVLGASLALNDDIALWLHPKRESLRPACTLKYIHNDITKFMIFWSNGTTAMYTDESKFIMATKGESFIPYP